MKTYYCVTTAFYDDGRVTAAITDEVQAIAKPESTNKTTSTKDIYCDWFESKEDATAFIKEAKEA